MSRKFWREVRRGLTGYYSPEAVTIRELRDKLSWAQQGLFTALTEPDPEAEELRAERDQARSVAVTLEQQNARALELLRRLNPERRELLEVIAVLAGDDAED